MSIYRGPYYSATSCKSAARAGTDALVSWYLGAYGHRGASNLGTYACKRLGSGWSIHAERRAADLGTAPYGGVDSNWGWAFANALRLNSKELGVQLIILGRKVWSCRYPDSGWRAYTGEYHGHAHVELIPSASTSLTPAKIQKIIGGDDMEIAELNAELRKPNSPLAAVSRAIPWQYVGGGIPDGMSTLGVLSAIHGYTKTTNELVRLLVNEDDVDEVALANALAPAVAGLVIPALVAAVEDNDGTALTEAQVTEAVKAALRQGSGDDLPE